MLELHFWIVASRSSNWKSNILKESFRKKKVGLRERLNGSVSLAVHSIKRSRNTRFRPPKPKLAQIGPQADFTFEFPANQSFAR
jgi:hypothetical protein